MQISDKYFQQSLFRLLILITSCNNSLHTTTNGCLFNVKIGYMLILEGSIEQMRAPSTFVVLNVLQRISSVNSWTCTTTDNFHPG